MLACLISLRLQLDSNALIFIATSADFIASDLMRCMHEVMAQSSRKIWKSGILNAMPPKKKAKALAEQVQPEAQETTESPPTESSDSSSKEFELELELELPTRRNFTRSKNTPSRVRPVSKKRPSPKKQREQDQRREDLRPQFEEEDQQREDSRPQFEEVPSDLPEEDLSAFYEYTDEAGESGWDSETQLAFTGAVSADAVTDGELSEESWPILQDLLFGGRGFPK